MGKGIDAAYADVRSSDPNRAISVGISTECGGHAGAGIGFWYLVRTSKSLLLVSFVWVQSGFAVIDM